MSVFFQIFKIFLVLNPFSPGFVSVSKFSLNSDPQRIFFKILDPDP